MSEPSRPQHESHTSGSHYQPGLGVMVLILVLFVAAATLMLRSTNSSGPGATTSTTTTTLASTQTTIAKTRVRVQVANGTNVTGLGRVARGEWARDHGNRLVLPRWISVGGARGCSRDQGEDDAGETVA
jgi:hypothetical protein